MLGQEAQPFGEIAPVIAWLVAAAVAFGPASAGITKLVDFLRGAFDHEDAWPGFIWIAAAMVIALLACLLFEINIIGGLFAQLPAFQGSDALSGTSGEIITAIGMGGFASYWHERMDKASAEADAARAIANPEVVELTSADSRP